MFWSPSYPPSISWSPKKTRSASLAFGCPCGFSSLVFQSAEKERFPAAASFRDVFFPFRCVRKPDLQGDFGFFPRLLPFFLPLADLGLATRIPRSLNSWLESFTITPQSSTVLRRSQLLRLRIPLLSDREAGLRVPYRRFSSGNLHSALLTLS